MSLFRKNQSTTQPLSSKAKPTGLGLGCLILFFLPFLAAGVFFFYVAFLEPTLNVLRAKNWVETPCEITSSQVTVHHGDSTTYGIEIKYKYVHQGQNYDSDRYQFAGGSSSGHAGKQAVVDRYPPGRRTICYVDPGDPASAVIERGMTLGIWLGLLTLIFIAVGGGGIWWAVRASRRSDAKQGKVDWLPKLKNAPQVAEEDAFGFGPSSSHDTGSVTLRPESTPLKTLIVSIVICLFWNGIVSVFVWQIYQSLRRGQTEWFLTLFMIPFVLVGLGLVLFVLYSFLGLFNPRPTLVLSSDRLNLGDTLELEWSFIGNTNALTRLQIYLEGVEEARYRRGTDTITDRATFIKLPLADLTDVLDMATGQARATLPADSMHSFDGGNNKIVWTLNVHGEISRWPDVKAKYPFLVLPLRQEER